jgi:hypothetical protein
LFCIFVYLFSFTFFVGAALLPHLQAAQSAKIYNIYIKLPEDVAEAPNRVGAFVK